MSKEIKTLERKNFSNITNILLKILFYLSFTYLFLNILSKGIIINAESIECSRAVNEDDCKRWAYNEVMEKKIFPERGFLCRKFGWDCFDEAVKNDPWKVNAMNEWWVNGAYGNFFQFLKHFNRESLNILCTNYDEYVSSFSPTLCFSTIRNCNEDSRKAVFESCPNPDKLTFTNYECADMMSADWRDIC